jgi:hypothetical protein
MQKCKVFLHPIDLQYDIIFFAFAKPLHFFAKRAEKGVFEG